ncbi:MAG TPA: lysylphosphatidylglycerol synthase transmembrane domain-containing protein [Thermoanaerobaculia bacterium]|nr:lysylphosphatidylglycerol synthase transmembrane domain-containing protein [Thermoanaerobaculia bacterium]
MTQEPRRSRLRAWVSTLLKLVLVGLAVALAVRLLAGVRWAEVAARLDSASWPILALAAFCLLARFAVWDVRWYLAMRRVERAPSLVTGFFSLLSSAAVNMVTPTVRLAGGLLRARYTARGGPGSFGRAYGVVLFDQLAHNAVMTALSWAAVIVVAFALGRWRLGWAALAAFVATGVALFVWSRRSGGGEGGGRLAALLARRAAAASGRVGRLLSHSHEAVEVFARLFADRRLRVQVVGIGAAFFLLNAFAQWLVFRGFGAEVRMAVVVGAVSLGLAAGMLTGVPGGIGATEAAMVATFAALGVDRIDAAAGTLLYRGLHYGVVLAVGLPALATLELRTSLRRGRAATS